MNGKRKGSVEWDTLYICLWKRLKHSRGGLGWSLLCSPTTALKCADVPRLFVAGSRHWRGEKAGTTVLTSAPPPSPPASVHPSDNGGGQAERGRLLPCGLVKHQMVVEVPSLHRVFPNLQSRVPLGRDQQRRAEVDGGHQVPAEVMHPLVLQDLALGGRSGQQLQILVEVDTLPIRGTQAP